MPGAPTELESMVVRILGNATQYLQEIASATEATRQAAQDIQKHSQEVEGFVGKAAQAMAAFGAGNILHRAFDMFVGMESTTLKLTAAVRMNGGAVEDTIKQYEDFASSMKSLTGIGKEETLNLLRRVESYGLTGAAAMNAARASTALAAINDGQATSFLRISAAVEKGDIAMAMHMSRLVPQLRGIKDQTEFMDKYQKLIATGMDTAGVIMNSTEGVMKRFHNTVAALTRQFGQLVAEAVKPVVEWLTKTLDQFTRLDPWVKRLVLGAISLAAGITAIGPAWSMVMKIIGPTLSLLPSLFGPWGLAIAAVVVIISKLADQFGGFSEMASAVWDEVQGAVAAFIEWFEPILGAAIGVAQAAWQVFSDVVLAIWDGIKSVVSSVLSAIGLENAITWETVKKFAIDTLLGIEFVFTHWKDVLLFGWTAIKLGAVWLWDVIKDAAIGGLAVLAGIGGTIVELFSAAWQNIKSAFIVAWSAIKIFALEVAKGLVSAVESILSTMENIPFIGNRITAALVNVRAASEGLTREQNEARAARDEAEFRNMGEAAATGWTAGFQGTIDRFAGVIGTSNIQRQLQREFEQQRDALGTTWDEFYNRRMAEINQFHVRLPGGTAANTAGAAAREAGQEFKKAADHVNNFNAALFGSADAIQRLAAQNKLLAFVAPSLTGAAVAAAAAGENPWQVGGDFAAPPPQANVGPPPVAVRVGEGLQPDMVDLLREIRDSNRDMANQPPIQVEALGGDF
jgi:hypothetical protein